MSGVDLARHLTGVRLLVLEILASAGPCTREEVLREWERRRPGLGVGHRVRLPRMRDETLWRLVILGWVAREGETYLLTGDGQRALSFAQSG